MKVSISSEKAFTDLTLGFVKAIAGPRLESFLAQDFGSGVRSVAVILELQNPKRTLKHHTKYFPDEKWLYCHVVLDGELESADPYRSIADTVQVVLTKLCKKAKGVDFAQEAFLAAISGYIDGKIVNLPPAKAWSNPSLERP